MTTGGTSGPYKDALALLWQPPSGGRRGPRPALTLDAIAQAAVGIADADGLAAVTMQRVATALGVTKMALYRYVPGKEELIALMVEAAIGTAPGLDTVPGGWRPRLDAWARQMFERFQGHPWVLEATVGSRAVGPVEFGWLEAAVAALDGTGLEGGEMLDVAATLMGHVRTMAQQGAGSGDQSPEAHMSAVLGSVLDRHEERFPALTAAFRSAAAHGSQDHALDFGLARILDGVELLLTRRGRA